MLDTFSYEQLDPATKAYLRDVRAGKGRGAPGVFYGQGSARPVWALLAGLVIMPTFLGIASISTKGQWQLWAGGPVINAAALLQTASILMGGWLILYAFRRWLASADSFAGWFFYFDPAHAYIGEGETIRIAALPSDTEISPTGQSSVQFITQHDGFTVLLPNRTQAAFVSDYYAAVDWVMGQREGRWAGIPLAEVGAVGRYLVEEDSEPPSIQDTGLQFNEIPEEVRAVRKPKSGILGYLAVIGVGVVLFGLFNTVNPGMQDDKAFENAKAKTTSTDEPEMTGAHALRDYLLNERNTRHRDEATQLLAGLYDKPINKVKLTATDPDLKNGMVALLEGLRSPVLPVVSIEVSDKSNATQPNGPMANGLREMISDGIAKTVGKDMIAFVKKPEDLPNVPALIDLKYQPGTRAGSVDWWVEIRLKPDDAKPFALGKGTATYFQAGFGGPAFPPIGGFGQPAESTDPNERAAMSSAMTEAIYKDVMMKMVGNAPAKTVIPVENDF